MKRYIRSSIEGNVSSRLRPTQLPAGLGSMFSIGKLIDRFGRDYEDDFIFDFFYDVNDYYQWLDDDFGSTDGSITPADTIQEELSIDTIDTFISDMCKQHSSCSILYVEEVGEGAGRAFYNPYCM